MKSASGEFRRGFSVILKFGIGQVTADALKR